MYNGQNNQNSGNQQYSNSSNNYQYNNSGFPQNNGMMNNNVQQPQYNSMQNQYNGMQNGTQQPNYQYQGYSQYPQTSTPQPSKPQTPPMYSGYQITGPKKNKKNKKILFLILGILIVAIIVVIVIFLLGNGKKGKKSSANNTNSNSTGNTEISLEEIMQRYGEELETKVAKYVTENGSLPDKDTILSTTKIEDYLVECETVDFYTNGKVYLDKCSINESEKIYSYGEATDESATMKEYGTKALAYVSDYSKTNKKLPSTIEVEINAKVECETVNIYDSETIYLAGCSINGSQNKQSFGFQKEDGYVYISHVGHSFEVAGETNTADYESDKLVKKKIKCTTDKCSLDKYLGPVIAIKESTGKIIIHNIQTSTSLVTLDKGTEYTFMGKDGVEVYGLLLRNESGKEALYSFGDKRINQAFGRYYYDWSPSKEYSGEWAKYPSIKTNQNVLPIKKSVDGKYSALNLNFGKELIPFEYDTVVIDNEYINVTKNKKRGLISLRGDKTLLGGVFYEEFSLAKYQQQVYALTYDGKLLQVVDVNGKLVKQVANIPSGYVLMNEKGYSSFYNTNINNKVVFTVLFKTNKPGTPCAQYTYNLTNDELKIDENSCELFKQ